MPRGSIEIDTPEDLELAEAMAPFLDRRDASPAPATPIEAEAIALDPRAMPADARVLVVDDGHAYLPREAGDGRAVERLCEAGTPFLIVSSELHPLPRTVGVPADVVRGSDDPGAAIAYWAAARGIDPARVAYLGTREEDLPALASVGWPVCTADAPAAVRAASRVVLRSTSAGGALEELADRMLDAAPEREPAPAPAALRPPIHELVHTDRTIHDLARPAHPAH